MKKHYEVCAALIKNNKNEYFVVQRGPKGEVAFKWEFPGGKIEENEIHEETLIREIKEELSMDIKVNNYIMTINHEYQTFLLTMHVYECDIINGKPVMLEDQKNYQWLTPLEMKNYDFAQADIPIIDMLMTKLQK